MLAKLDDMVQGLETGKAPALSVSSSDPVGRKLLALQKNLEKQKKQADKEAKKLKDENQRLQDRMSRIERVSSMPILFPAPLFVTNFQDSLPLVSRQTSQQILSQLP